ncbi:hypothetical protein GYA37_00280 [candidate division WWE3 bacterium]|uniref:Uncharacterized protein n=1 Tax=candidate division WWE3 bacterium TaxID=2053526 RepID=A0A7X9E693_UNCKA|nr:hypothetical protein [candidate division WWE3 bacterium]
MILYIWPTKARLESLPTKDMMILRVTDRISGDVQQEIRKILKEIPIQGPYIEKNSEHTDFYFYKLEIFFTVVLQNLIKFLDENLHVPKEEHDL